MHAFSGHTRYAMALSLCVFYHKFLPINPVPSLDSTSIMIKSLLNILAPANLEMSLYPVGARRSYLKPTSPVKSSFTSTSVCFM